MKAKRGEHPFGDTVQLIFLFLFVIVWVADSFLMEKSTFLADFIPLSLRLVILGLALFAGACLYKSGHVVVSRGRPLESLVSSGAFRYVRHPLYLSAILFYFGLAVATASLFSMALLVLIFLFYDFIANFEESLLEERYGEEYLLYKSRTGKWIPRIRKRFSR